MEKIKTTARIEGRYYVPSMTIAIKFCHLEFSGEDKDRLESEWHKIKFENIEPMEKLIEETDNLIRKKADSLPKMRLIVGNFLVSRKEKRCIYKEIKELKAKKEEYEERKFKNVAILLIEAQSFLQENGFVLANVNSLGSIETEIYYLYNK